MLRREFLLTSAAAALPAATWNSGNVVHLLPAAGSRRIILKSSFREPLAKAPLLALDGARPAPGRRGDTRGLFWSFDVDGLEPARRYTLRLLSDQGKPLCDEWPLRTLPSPEEQSTRLRLGIYTCAGGHEAIRDPNGANAFLPLAVRQRFLSRLLSFQPDAVIAIGDHVYWDQRSAVANRGRHRNQQQSQLAGDFDRSLPIFGTPNEQVLQKAAGPQIADLYGTMMRSVPTFFVQDDHDYYDNDEASDSLVTFPPDAFMLRAARATRSLYYPEFLPEVGRPDGLAGSFEFEPNIRYSECFGTLRWGKLAELLIYDCRRHLTLTGPSAGFIPDTAEQWLTARTRSADTRHLVHVPSVPFGWSAGKWGDWYPDILGDDGKLTIRKPKPYWQEGWRKQHDRILGALSANRDRIPLVVSGDLHSHAIARIQKSGAVDWSKHAPTVMIAGPVSTAASGWPSSARGTVAQGAIGLELDSRVPVVEHNGFTIAEFTDRTITLKLYGWKAGTPEQAIDTLEPFHSEQLRI